MVRPLRRETGNVSLRPRSGNIERISVTHRLPPRKDYLYLPVIVVLKKPRTLSPL